MRPLEKADESNISHIDMRGTRDEAKIICTHIFSNHNVLTGCGKNTGLEDTEWVLKSYGSQSNMKAVLPVTGVTLNSTAPIDRSVVPVDATVTAADMNYRGIDSPCLSL